MYVRISVAINFYRNINDKVKQGPKLKRRKREDIKISSDNLKLVYDWRQNQQHSYL